MFNPVAAFVFVVLLPVGENNNQILVSEQNEMVEPVCPKKEREFIQKVDVEKHNKTLFEEFNAFQKEEK